MISAEYPLPEVRDRPARPPRGSIRASSMKPQALVLCMVMAACGGRAVTLGGDAGRSTGEGDAGFADAVSATDGAAPGSYCGITTCDAGVVQAPVGSTIQVGDGCFCGCYYDENYQYAYKVCSPQPCSCTNQHGP